MSRARGVLVVLAVLGAVAGCAGPMAGTPVAATVAGSPSADPNSPEAKWMNRFCGMSKLLITAGDTAQTPVTSSDPAVLKRQFVDTTGRLVGVLDAVLSDLRALRPAPAPQVDPVLGELIDSLSESRTAIGTAKADVEAVEPMTVEVYSAAVDRFGTAMGGLERALRTMNALDLPDELADAGGAARNCADPAPPTTR